MINEAKNIAQKNYVDQKIIHVIVKKFIFDDQEFFEIPDKEINYNSLEINSALPNCNDFPFLGSCITVFP